MRFCVGERVVHTAFGKGTIVGEFQVRKVVVYHVLLDHAAPLHYSLGRPHVYAFECQLKEDIDE